MVDFSRIAGGWESPEWVIFDYRLWCGLSCRMRRQARLIRLRVGISGFGGGALQIQVEQKYTKNIDLRHIFALYRKLATGRRYCYDVTLSSARGVYLHHLQTVLNLGLLCLGLILVVFLAKKRCIWQMCCSRQNKPANRAGRRTGGLLSLFRIYRADCKYFQSGFHFPLRYFVYIGITPLCA